MLNWPDVYFIFMVTPIVLMIAVRVEIISEMFNIPAKAEVTLKHLKKIEPTNFERIFLGSVIPVVNVVLTLYIVFLLISSVETFEKLVSTWDEDQGE